MNASPLSSLANRAKWRSPAKLALELLPLAALALSGCEAPSPTHVVNPTLVATSEHVPFTDTRFVLLLGESGACLIDSFESRVVCGDRAWQDTFAFGREGEGPGEYQGPNQLALTPGGEIAVVDYTQMRLTYVSERGKSVSTLPFDSGLVHIVRDASDSILRFTATNSMEQLRAWRNSMPVQTRIAAVDPVTRHITWRTLTLPDTVPPPRVLHGGTWSPKYGYVFISVPYSIYRFTPDGRFAGVLHPAHYEPEFPSRRDVEQRRYALTKIFRSPPLESEIEEYRTKPKAGLFSLVQLTFDANDLLWVATTRDRTERSYLDLYAAGGTQFMGSVAVRDRMLAFDVRGNTLAVLVEREDAGGVPRYDLDWYDIRAAVDSLQSTASAGLAQVQR